MSPDLKNTTDDALPNYLNSLKFQQRHLYTDVRLALGYTAVVVAAATFAFDYKLGWERTKAGTLWAVIVYFALNSALTYWIWGVESGRVYVGEWKGKKVCFVVLNVRGGVLRKIEADLWARSRSRLVRRNIHLPTSCG